MRKRVETRKKIVSIMLCILMVIGLMPVMPEVAKAEAGTTSGVSYVSYTWDNDNSTLDSKTNSVALYTTVDANTTAMSSGWYVVSSEVTINSRLSVTGDVHLILADGANLTVDGGIGLLGENSNITIYGQEAGTGKLSVDGVTDHNAGIGANNGGDCGNITIYGGEITAIGPLNGAGIGSGFNGSSCGDITIYGGEITATVGSGGEAGIGSGFNGSSCGDITIYGGEITATGEQVGIGSGFNDSSCGDITIYGGEITATGGEAGIGSGFSDSSCGDITIYGGEITATGGEAGIGSGYWDSSCGDITIYGGEITATGGNTGIGNGTYSTAPIVFSLNGNSQVYTSGMNVTNTNLNSGILFIADTGTVYGDVTISKDFEIKTSQTLEIPEGVELEIKDGVTFTNNGSIINKGKVSISNTATLISGAGSHIECTSHYCSTSSCEAVIDCDLCGGNMQTIPHQIEYTVNENVITVTCDSDVVNCSIRGAKLTLDADSVTYSGKAYDAVKLTIEDNFPEKNSISTIPIVYKDSEGKELNEAPTDAGTYTANITVGEGAAKVTATKTFTINPGSISSSVEQAGILAYTGEPLTPTVSELAYTENNQTATFQYSTVDGGPYGDMPTFTEIGKYTVYYQVSAPNHASRTGCFEVEIIKGESCCTTPPAAKDLIYTGGDLELVTPGVTNAGTIMYSLSKDGTYTTDIPIGCEIGDYTVWYYIVGDKNHNDSAKTSVSVTIKEAPQSMGGAGTPNTPEGPQSPVTGDNNNIALWMMILVAGLGLVVAGQKKRVR